jgi:hypothetical protein
MLHHIGTFRDALLRLEPAIAGQEVVSQMRDLFLSLEYGPRSFVDPTDFAKSLELDHAVQQVRGRWVGRSCLAVGRPA